MSVAPIQFHEDDPTGFRFEDLPDTRWPRYEIFDGSLYVTPAPVPDHQIIAHRLACALDPGSPDELQVLQGANVLRRGTTHRFLIPDVLVVDQSGVTWAREKRLSYFQPEDVYLAVEIISPSSRSVDLGTKRDFYLEWRTPLYWVLDPLTQEIHEFGLVDSADTWIADVDLTSIWPSQN